MRQRGRAESCRCGWLQSKYQSKARGITTATAEQLSGQFYADLLKRGILT